MHRSFLSRYRFGILLATVLLSPFVFWGAQQAVQSTSNEVTDWLPEGFEETATHAWFQEHFPYEQFVLISWDGCTLEDPRLESLARELENQDSSYGQAEFVKQVLTAGRLVQRLQSRYESLSKEDILKKVEGALVGPDHQHSCIVVTLSGGLPDREIRKSLQTLRQIASERCGIPADSIRMGGPPVDNVAISVEGERTLYQLSAVAGLISLAIAWLCFRSLRLTLFVFLCAILAAQIGLASVHWNGDWVDAIVMMMPSLLYVLAISGSVHIINYYHDAIRENHLPGGAPEGAIRRGWYPCTIAAVTTAIGLISLRTSYVLPISKFGLYSAWGVMATLPVLFLVLPALLHVFPSRNLASETAARNRAVDGNDLILKAWQFVGGFVIRRNVLVTVACFAVMAMLSLGVRRIETTVSITKFFQPEAEIVQNYRWLHKHLGPIVPMEIVLRFDNQECTLNFLDRMRLAERVEKSVETMPQVGGALSAASFGPDLWSQAGTGTTIARIFGIDQRQLERILNKRLRQHRHEFREYLSFDLDRGASSGRTTENTGPGGTPLNPTLMEMGVRREAAGRLEARGLADARAILEASQKRSLEELLRSTGGLAEDQATGVAETIRNWQRGHGEELWRVTARVTAAGDLDYGLFVDELKGAVEPILDRYRAAGYDGIEVSYTGLVPLVYKTQRELLRSLFRSLMYAFVLIAVVMMIVLKGSWTGLVAMIPNLFPVVTVFGLMGWVGIPIDVGSVMTATIGLGVAVDDTIHYVTWFRRGLDRGLDRKQSAMLAYRRCATAMTQTSLIAGLGLAAFIFSTFVPTQRFGTLMLSLLIAALVGDLIFLPALLTGPLGRLFQRKVARPPSDGAQPCDSAEPPDEAATAIQGAERPA